MKGFRRRRCVEKSGSMLDGIVIQIVSFSEPQLKNRCTSVIFSACGSVSMASELRHNTFKFVKVSALFAGGSFCSVIHCKRFFHLAFQNVIFQRGALFSSHIDSVNR